MESAQNVGVIRLFDDCERTDCAPRRHNESVFDFYNRSGWARCARIGPDPFAWSTVIDDIRGHLKRKAKKYGTPLVPLVIAINVIDWMYEGHQEMAQALFGTVRETARVSFSESKEPLVESFLKQEKDGLLFDGNDSHYREVSAVLVFKGTGPWSLGVVTSRLFLNPWSLHPLTMALRDFPRTFAKDGVLVHEGGKSVAQILRLPTDWPGTEN
jgi:hypothetical protein